MAGGYALQSLQPLLGDHVAYRGEPIAVVVADTLPAAAEAAAVVRAEYEADPVSVELDSGGAETVEQAAAIPLPMFADVNVGDADGVFADCPVQVDTVFDCPPQGSVALADRSRRETGAVTSSGSSSVFAGFRFPPEVISVAVRWFDAVLADAGIRTVLCNVQTPRMNAIAERWIGGCRRELLDRTLVWNQNHLRHILHAYVAHHNQHRPHRSLHGAAPLKSLPEAADLDQYRVRRQTRVGGLINEYSLVA